MIIGRTRYKWIVGLGIILFTFAAFFGVAIADSPDSVDIQLLNQANQAINNKNWTLAVDRILAYLKRSPDAFEDKAHAQSVLNTLTMTMAQIKEQISELNSDLCWAQEEKREAGTCTTFFKDPLPQPAKIPLPSTSPANPSTTKLVCRGGGENTFVYAASST